MKVRSLHPSQLEELNMLALVGHTPPNFAVIVPNVADAVLERGPLSDSAIHLAWLIACGAILVITGILLSDLGAGQMTPKRRS